MPAFGLFGILVALWATPVVATLALAVGLRVADRAGVLGSHPDREPT